MAGKIALMGFDRVSLFPIIQNDSLGYAVGAVKHMLNVQSMTKAADTAETKIYADDSLYMNVVNNNGLTVNITFAEMSLKDWAELGFGDYDEETNTLDWNPQGKNLEFGITLRCLQANGEYRMYRFYRLSLSAVNETDANTKGDSAAIAPYTVVGTISVRAYDNKLGQIHDGTDFDWLDEIPDMPEI